MVRKLLVVSVFIIVIASIVVGCTLVTPSTTSARAASPMPGSTEKISQTTSIPNTALYTGPFIGSKNSNVYHDPSCPQAQKILQQNLVTFPNAQAAQAAGYRPCKVCNP
ncbi:MAG: Ada metal-binding domain-containing protein, partial [Halobacteriota archaeon]